MILELQKEIANQLKTQNAKVKTATKKSKLLEFLVLTCSFAFCLLSFTFSCYAMDTSRLKEYFLKGDYKQALIEGEKIIQKSEHIEELDEVYYFLGLSYMKDGNYLRASDIFEIIIKEFGRSHYKEKAKLGLGDTFFLRGKWDEAEKYYNEILEKNPRTDLEAAIYYRLSKISFNRGQPQKGKEYLDKINKISPNNLEVRDNAQMCYLLDKDSEVKYAVQVGSFSNRKNAENLVSALQEKGYDAYLEETHMSSTNTIFYRVKVGRFIERKDAEAAESKLAFEGYPTRICP